MPEPASYHAEVLRRLKAALATAPLKASVEGGGIEVPNVWTFNTAVIVHRGDLEYAVAALDREMAVDVPVVTPPEDHHERTD